MYMLILNFTYPLRCLRVPPVEYHWSRQHRSSSMCMLMILITNQIPEQKTVAQLVTKLLPFWNPAHWTLSRAWWFHSTFSHLICVWFILMLSSHVRLNLSRGFCPPGFPNCIVPHGRCMACPFYLTWLVILIIFGEQHKIWNPSL
jgi:hypothetical protein